MAVNAPPIGQFGYSPIAPVAGQEVFFQSFSYDIDGTVVTHEWDFTGPGRGLQRRRRQRDRRVCLHEVHHAGGQEGALAGPRQPRRHASGQKDCDRKTALTVFTAPGRRIVRLEVRDSAGAVHTETQTVEVKGQSRPVAAVAGPSLMYPFPVVRLAGSVITRGARVRTLEVRAPARSKITVRCRGNSCPAKRLVKASKSRTVHFKRMARFICAGTVITVAVRKGNMIGKHTRWLIRAAKLPQRKDSCLYPGKSKPRRCPRS